MLWDSGLWVHAGLLRNLQLQGQALTCSSMLASQYWMELCTPKVRCPKIYSEIEREIYSHCTLKSQKSHSIIVTKWVIWTCHKSLPRLRGPEHTAFIKNLVKRACGLDMYTWLYIYILEQSVTMLSVLDKFWHSCSRQPVSIFSMLISVGYFFPLRQTLETTVKAVPQNRGMCISHSNNKKQ